MNYILFISDLHLQESKPQKTAMFLKFLKEHQKAKALYILGDLFEAWIGDDIDTEFTRTIQSALKQYVALGVSTYVMPGNHDFLLGKKFAKNTDCIIIKESMKINLYGKDTLLIHGDSLCVNDHAFMRLRKYMYNPKLQKYFLMLPIFIRKIFAKKIQARVKNKGNLKIDKIKDIDAAARLNLIRQHHVKQLIYGHVHKATNDKIQNKECRYITLGAWHDVPNYLVYYEDHTIKFFI